MEDILERRDVPGSRIAVPIAHRTGSSNIRNRRGLAPSIALRASPAAILIIQSLFPERRAHVSFSGHSSPTGARRVPTSLYAEFPRYTLEPATLHFRGRDVIIMKIASIGGRLPVRTCSR